MAGIMATYNARDEVEKYARTALEGPDALRADNGGGVSPGLGTLQMSFIRTREFLSSL